MRAHNVHMIVTWWSHDIHVGGTVSIGEKDQWWDRVEVSSNGHRKDRIVDGDPTTYWESAGRSGSHYVRFYMKKGLVVRCVPIVCKYIHSFSCITFSHWHVYVWHCVILVCFIWNSIGKCTFMSAVVTPPTCRSVSPSMEDTPLTTSWMSAL